jgi:hypothetical protein
MSNEGTDPFFLVLKELSEKKAPLFLGRAVEGALVILLINDHGTMKAAVSMLNTDTTDLIVACESLKELIADDFKHLGAPRNGKELN